MEKTKTIVAIIEIHLQVPEHTKTAHLIIGLQEQAVKLVDTNGGGIPKEVAATMIGHTTIDCVVKE